MEDATRLSAAGPYYSPNRTDYEGMLRVLLEHPGITLQSIVAYHIGELRIEGLRDALMALQSDPELGATVSRALDRLDGRELTESDRSDPTTGDGPSDPSEREQVT